MVVNDVVPVKLGVRLKDENQKRSTCIERSYLCHPHIKLATTMNYILSSLQPASLHPGQQNGLSATRGGAKTDANSQDFPW